MLQVPQDKRSNSTSLQGKLKKLLDKCLEEPRFATKGAPSPGPTVENDQPKERLGTIELSVPIGSGHAQLPVRIAGSGARPNPVEGLMGEGNLKVPKITVVEVTESSDRGV
jgi:hypothetical protein